MCGVANNNSPWIVPYFMQMSVLLRSCCCKQEYVLELLSRGVVCIICATLCKLGPCDGDQFECSDYLSFLTLAEKSARQFILSLTRHLRDLFR